MKIVRHAMPYWLPDRKSEAKKEMERDAKGALEQALQREVLHVKNVRGELAVGNNRGLNLAGLPQLVRELESEVALLKDCVSS